MSDWRIVFTNAAVKGLKRLSREDQQRVRAGIDRLMNGDVKKLKGRTNEFRLRVGDVRAVFSPKFETNEIIVLEVFPRGDQYR